jgi:hypothetical protein
MLHDGHQPLYIVSQVFETGYASKSRSYLDRWQPQLTIRRPIIQAWFDGVELPDVFW